MRQFKVNKTYVVETEILVSARNLHDAIQDVDDVDFQRMSELRDYGDAKIINIDEHVTTGGFYE